MAAEVRAGAESLPVLQEPQMAGGKAEVNIIAIELDASIQCRAVIDTGTVAEYAERMEAGDAFPPVVLFGTVKRCWIGDGWHRVMAARQLGRTEIEADLREGDRRDALKYALGANAANGLRRTNADKRRCVEIALAEFGNLSSRAIAGLCGVSDKTVEASRKEHCGSSAIPTRTTSDGRQYPAARKPAEVKDDEDDEETENEQKEVITDPLSGKANAPDIDAEDETNSDPPNLAGLKRYWNYANKRERKAFLQYIKE
jgi:hypothetical protein